MNAARRATYSIALVAATASTASAHGVNGHVHATGWAIEELPPGELRDFFADPVMRDTAQIAAGFPDSGYAIGDPYGEMAHWEPFVTAYVAYIRQTYGADLTTEPARRNIAFLLGSASHGFQDEIFDTLFLRYLIQEDGQDQDVSDPGTDAMLYTDGWLEFKPPLFVPSADLVHVFQAADNYMPTERAMIDGMTRVKLLVIDHFDAVAPIYDARYRPLMPWGSQHYVDPDLPGSIRSEGPATAAYIQALWERVHGRFDSHAPEIYTYPNPTRRLRGVDPARVDNRISVLFGTGAYVRSLNAERVHLYTPDHTEIAIDVQHTRWTTSPDDLTRQVLVIPLEPLALDTEYRVEIQAGVELGDGRTTPDDWSYTFKTPCPEQGACSDGPPAHPGDPLDPARVSYPEAVVPDAGTPDAAPVAADAAPPLPVADAAPVPAVDAAPAPAVDAAPVPDTTPVPDAAPSTAPTDAALVAQPDAAASASSGNGGGGGCQTAVGAKAQPLSLVAAFAALLIGLRGRSRPRLG